MPLLNDAKTCFVGTQPITTIMAGSVQVWSKGPSLYPTLSAYYMAPPEVNPNGTQPTVLISCEAINCAGLDHCYLYRKTSNPGTNDGSWQETNYGKPISESPDAKYKVFLTDHTDQFFFDFFMNPSSAQKDIVHRIERKIDGKSYMGPEWQFPYPLILDPITPPGLRTHECDGLEEGFSFADAQTLLAPWTGPGRRQYYESSFVASPPGSKTNREVYDLLDIEMSDNNTEVWAAVPFDDITFERWSTTTSFAKLRWRSGMFDPGSNINWYSAFRFKNKADTEWFTVAGKS